MNLYVLVAKRVLQNLGLMFQVCPYYDPAISILASAFDPHLLLSFCH